MRFTLLVLLSLSIGARAQEALQPERSGEADWVEKIGEAERSEYFGRKVARTMHWAGASWLLRETREEEENAARMLELLGIEPGMTVCDLGCGNGYHTLRLARMVGPEGKVFAVDIQPPMLEMLRERCRAEGIENVIPVLGTYRDPRLDPESCDLILLADVYHEFSYPQSMLWGIREALRKPHGRAALLEFRLEDSKVPIKLEHRMAKQQMLGEWGASYFDFESESDELPWQHLIFFRGQKVGPGAIEGKPEDPLADTPGRNLQEQVAQGFLRALTAKDRRVLEHFLADEIEWIERGEELSSIRLERRQASARLDARWAPPVTASVDQDEDPLRRHTLPEDAPDTPWRLARFGDWFKVDEETCRVVRYLTDR